MEDTKPVQLAMKVWKPDGTTYKTPTISGQDEYVGNLVAEGKLPAEEYYPELVRILLAQQDHFWKQYMTLNREYVIALFEIERLKKASS